MSTTATDEKRGPLNIEINGRAVVSSSKHYTVDEAADIQRMVVAAFNWVAGGREEYRVNPGALQIVKDVRRYRMTDNGEQDSVVGVRVRRMRTRSEWLTQRQTRRDTL